MREIKFRFFDTTLKEMFSQSQIEDYTLEQINRFSSTEDQYTKVMQFTGMLDTNGVEIYEGDILLCEKDYHWSISFLDGKFIAYAPDTIYDFVNLDDYQFKVVGNIHQHAHYLVSK